MNFILEIDHFCTATSVMNYFIVITTHITPNCFFRRPTLVNVFSQLNQIAMVRLRVFLSNWSSHINWNNYNVPQLLQTKKDYIVFHFDIVLNLLKSFIILDFIDF